MPACEQEGWRGRAISQEELDPNCRKEDKASANAREEENGLVLPFRVARDPNSQSGWSEDIPSRVKKTQIPSSQVQKEAEVPVACLKAAQFHNPASEKRG